MRGASLPLVPLSATYGNHYPGLNTAELSHYRTGKDLSWYTQDLLQTSRPPSMLEDLLFCVILNNYNMNENNEQWTITAHPHHYSEF